MSRYLYIILGMFLSYVSSANVESKATVRFIIDKAILEKGEVELELSLYSYYYIKATELYDQREVKIITDSLTQFEFDANQDISVLTVQLFVNKERYLFYLNQSAYLVEKEDTLTWKVDDRITLLGDDHSKNRIREMIRRMDRNVSISWLSYYINHDQIDTYFHLTNEYYDALAYRKIQYLDKLKTNYSISAEVYDYIKEECVYDTESRRVNQLSNSMERGAIYQKAILPYAFAEIEKIKLRNESNLGGTYSFIQYLMDLISAEYFIEEYTEEPERAGVVPQLDVLFEKIKSLPNADLRPQLAAFLFARFESYGVNGQDIIREAIDMVSDSKLKSYLVDVKTKRYSRAPIYPFKFEDIEGNVFTAEYFKGKKVIFDFWFNGCSGCAVLHQYLLKFEEELNDPNVVFVSVNVDKRREKWVHGLVSGKYTSHDGLNLRVMDNKADILAYYEFTSYPQLLVMDEAGSLISYETPKPIDTGAKEKFKRILYPQQ